MATDRQTSDKTPEYKKIAQDELRITETFLEKNRGTILQKLITAHSKMVSGTSKSSGPNEVLGINQCLHLASSVILRGGGGVALENALKYIETHFIETRETPPKPEKPDPTILLTVATLYFLILDQVNRGELTVDQQAIIRDMRQLFDMRDWLLSREGMQSLDIERITPNSVPTERKSDQGG